MTEQKFVYVDVDYLKELEETAKKVDYYKGIIDGIMMCKEAPQTHDIRTNTHECVKDTHDKTENSSEKPNNSTISKMEQVEDEPQTCDNCELKGTTKWCNNQEVCRAYKPKDTPQTDCPWK